MHFLNIFHIFVLLWASLAVADTTTSTTSTVSPSTLVWVTGTDSNGVTKTTQSLYTQKFTSFYSSVAQPSSGSIGMSTISASVGGIRTYSRTTINGAEGGLSAGVFVSTILPLFSAFLGLFML